MDCLFIRSDRRLETEQIFKDWVSLYKSKKIPDGFEVYGAEIGSDLPMYVLIRGGKSMSDFYSQIEKNEALLGKEGKELSRKSREVIRKFEHRSGWRRMDLSLKPAEKVQGE